MLIVLLKVLLKVSVQIILAFFVYCRICFLFIAKFKDVMNSAFYVFKSVKAV